LVTIRFQQSTFKWLDGALSHEVVFPGRHRTAAAPGISLLPLTEFRIFLIFLFSEFSFARVLVAEIQ